MSNFYVSIILAFAHLRIEVLAACEEWLKPASWVRPNCYVRWELLWKWLYGRGAWLGLRPTDTRVIQKRSELGIRRGGELVRHWSFAEKEKWSGTPGIAFVLLWGERRNPGTTFWTIGLYSCFMALVIHAVCRVYATHFRGINSSPV